MIRILALVAALVCAVPAIAQPLPANLDKANAIVIDTTKGRIVVKLRNDLAPQHAERIKLLAREGYYNNVPFHHVIEGFMAQTGDGKNFNGTGGSKYPNLPAEFSNVPYKRGIVGMARTSRRAASRLAGLPPFCCGLHRVRMLRLNRSSSTPSRTSLPNCIRAGRRRLPRAPTRWTSRLSSVSTARAPFSVNPRLPMNPQMPAITTGLRTELPSWKHCNAVRRCHLPRDLAVRLPAGLWRSLSDPVNVHPNLKRKEHG